MARTEATAVKRPKWLWDSRATKSDNLKKARRQTDQRMKQQGHTEKTTGRVSEEKIVDVKALGSGRRNGPEAEAISVRPVSFNRNGALCA